MEGKICDGNINRHYICLHSQAVISGWGTTSSGGSQPAALQKANVEVYADSVATGAYGSIADAAFPAGVADFTIDSCQVICTCNV